jgi:hypothetical protein
VPSDDLSSIPDLQDKHRRVLARELKVTTFRGLVQADRRDIQQAMRNLRPRPTLEQIAQWQDHARSSLNQASADRSDWHPAASFAVVFAERQAGDGWQRRIEVERTEVEPEEESRIWPGWDCEGIGRWMREQVPGGAQAEPEAARPAEPASTPAEVARERPELRIDRVTVIGLATSPEVVAADAAAATSAGPPGPPRIEISVSGGRRGQEINASAQVLREREFGWKLQDPVVITGGTGVASFDLSRLPAGRYDLALAAWAPDGKAEPALEEVAGLTIPPLVAQAGRG